MSATTSSESPTRPRWYLAVLALVYLANALLILGVILLKLTEGNSLFSPMIIVVLLAIVGTLRMAHTGWLQLLLKQLSLPFRIGAAIGMVVVGFVGLAVIPHFIPAFDPYMHSFMNWLMPLVLALLIMSVSGYDDESDKNFVAIGLISILALLVILEIGLRVWFVYFAPERERLIYTGTIEQIQAREKAFMGLPYVNFGLSPGYPTHNSQGYRGPEIEVPKPVGVFRIVALGGSTTYGYDLVNWEDAFPAQLEAILHDEYGYANIEVINAGVGGYSTWESLANFAFRVLDLEPDLAIVYHATNDITFRLVNPTYYNGLNPVRGVWQFEDIREPLSPSVLHRFIGINLGWMTDPASLDARLVSIGPFNLCWDEYFCNEFEMTPREALDANPPIYFERNLRSLIGMAQVHDVSIMLSSWAYFPDELQGERHYMTYDFRQEAVAEHNAIARRIADEMGVAFYDLMENIPYDPAFWIDGRHMTVEGAHEQAVEYAAFLVEQEMLPLP